MTDSLAIIELGLLRIAVFGAMFCIDQIAAGDTSSIASLPAGLRAPIPAAHWIDKWVSLKRRNVSIIAFTFKIACLFAAIGFLTPFTAPLAAILAIYVLAIPSLFGGVRAFHHLWWFAAILSTVPCGTSISVDSAFGLSGRADFPFIQALGAIRLILGLIYFFPGVWKLRRGGLRWGNRIPNVVSLMWFDRGGVPSFLRNVMKHGVLLTGLGLAVIAFELDMPILIFCCPAAALVTGLMFHLASALILDIPFWHLQICYVALIPSRWLEPLSYLAGLPTDSTNHLWILSLNQPGLFYVVTGTVILGVITFGLLGIRSWPFAVYPTFCDGVPGTTTTLSFVVEYHGGESCAYDVADLLSHRMASRRAMTLVSYACRDDSRRGQRLEALRQLCELEIACSPKAWRFVAIERLVDSPESQLKRQVLLRSMTA